MYNYIKNPIALHTGNQTYKENTMKSNPLGVRKGIWTPEEDNLLRKCIESFGEGKWHLVPLRAGLNRCRKSCRLRWLNYLKPNIKRGQFTKDEVDLIIRLHKLLGNRWSLIAGRLPGRTANDVKNYWNSHIEKKLATESLPGRVRAHQKFITSTNIVRPRPLTFSHLRPQCRWQQGTRTPETCQTPLVTGMPNTMNNDLDPPYLCHEADDECRRWWSSLLQMARDNPQTGLHDDFCNLNQHGEQGDVEGFTDFSIDVDIWKLLSFEDEG